MDYGGCADYMHMSVEAFGLWHQWNKERAELNRPPVFHQSGVLLFSQNGSFSEFEKESIRQIQQAGYGHFIEIYDTPEKLVAKFPRFESAVKNGFNVAYLNKEGGTKKKRYISSFFGRGKILISFLIVCI
jgi:sarcosine oxidase/L-pipecolate oxidase